MLYNESRLISPCYIADGGAGPYEKGSCEQWEMGKLKTKMMAWADNGSIKYHSACSNWYEALKENPAPYRSRRANRGILWRIFKRAAR